jgi:hypothetical protein
MTGDEDTTSRNQVEEGEEFLAALGNFDLMAPEEVVASLEKDRDSYFVDTLPLLPDDGIGVGEANLYRIAARAQGERPHRTTWVVSIGYDFDGPGEYHVLTHVSEADARTDYAELVQARLDEGRLDPQASTPT